MSKRALVLMGGTLEGAYTGGVLSVLCKELGNNYFRDIYAVSVGTCGGAFFASNQPDTMENTWRNHVNGKKLVDLQNPFHKKTILNFKYLTKIFKNKISKLDLETLFDSGVTLSYFVFEENSKKYSWVKPVRKNIFDLMEASSSLPIVHGGYQIKDKRYLDTSFIYNAREILEMIDLKRYEEIIVIVNQKERKKDFIERVFVVPLFERVFRKIKEKPIPLRTLIKKGKIKVIRPTKKLPLRSVLDTNKKRLNKTVDWGIRDANKFLRSYIKAK